MDEQTARSIDWSRVTADDLKEAANDSKSKLPSLFERVWLRTMGDVIPCIGCKGFEKKLILFQQKLIKMAESKCQYLLKGKYNGVWGYSNAELTDKKAAKLAKEHPRGYELFAELPKEIQDKIDKEIAEIEDEKKAITDKLKKQVEQDKADAVEKLQTDADGAEIKTMLDKQIEAEQIKKELEEEAKTRSQARLVELLGKDKTWLKTKIKKLNKLNDLNLSVSGSEKELAKRIHQNE